MDLGPAPSPRTVSAAQATVTASLGGVMTDTDDGIAPLRHDEVAVARRTRGLWRTTTGSGIWPKQQELITQLVA